MAGLNHSGKRAILLAYRELTSGEAQEISHKIETVNIIFNELYNQIQLENVLSIHQGCLMLQAQKASLSFQAMTQVRNKLVEAYKEVINMPL